MGFDELSDYQKRTFLIGKSISDQLNNLDSELAKNIESLEIPAILRLLRINKTEFTSFRLSKELGFITNFFEKIENGDFEKVSKADLKLIFNSFGISSDCSEIINKKIDDLNLSKANTRQALTIERYQLSSFKVSLSKLKGYLSKKPAQIPLTDEQVKKFEKFLAPDALKTNDIIEPVIVLDGQGYREPKIQEDPDKSIIINNLAPEKPTKPSTLLRDVENSIFKAREKEEKWQVVIAKL